MDLLEIRKKAKDLKEGEEKPVSGAGPAEAPGPDPEEAPAAVSPPPAPKKGKKQAKKRGAKAGEKPSAMPAASGAATIPVPGADIEDAMAKAPAEPARPPVAASAEVAEPDTADEVVEYISFMLDKEEYAVKVEEIKEIIRAQHITMVPRTPDFVIGIISLRGVILPVFDIKKRLGLDCGDIRKTARIIVVSDSSGLHGMMVDKVTGVARLKKGGIEPPPSIIGGIEAEYLDGLGRIGDRLLILFNTNRVLSL